MVVGNMFWSESLTNLYNERLAVRVKLKSKWSAFDIESSGSENQSGSEEKELVISLDVGAKPCGKKVMMTKITDESDPYFLFTSTLTPEDYQVYCATQGFLVSFNEFPSQVVRFLNLCKSQVSNRRETSKYMLTLDDITQVNKSNNFVGLQLPTQTPTTWVLQVIEVNSFKQTCHLALHLNAASDKEIIEQMSTLFKCLNEKRKKDFCAINELQVKLEQASEINKEKCKELESLKEHWEDDKKKWKSFHQAQLANEKEELTKLNRECENMFSREKIEIENRYQAKIRKLEHQVVQLKSEAEILLEKENKMETSVRQKSGRIEALEKENAALLEDVIQLRKQKNQVDKELLENETNVNALISKCGLLEQEVKEKRSLVMKQQELLRLASDNKTHMEKIITDKEMSLKKKEETLNTMTHELVTANQVINNLSSEMLLLKNKVKTRSSLVLEQEKLIEKHRANSEELEKEIMEIQHKLKLSFQREQEMKNRIEELEENLKAGQEKLKINENVINFLHRKLNTSTKNEHGSIEPKPLSKTGTLDSVNTRKFITSTPFGISSSIFPFHNINSNSNNNNNNNNNSNNPVCSPIIESLKVSSHSDNCQASLSPASRFTPESVAMNPQRNH